MGWISRVKEIISGLRASGKSEDEVKEIVVQASDKATVTNEVERIKAEVASELGVPEKLLAVPEYEQQYKYFAEAAGETMRRLIEKIREAGMTAEQVAATIRTMHGIRQQESNNWRKMHGLPMRRKGKQR